jgi:hypothetical protein
MERKIVITYRWSSESEIPLEHIEALEETAMSRIFDMVQEGYFQGELSDNILMTDNDPEDGVEYHGWWEMKRETL